MPTVLLIVAGLIVAVGVVLYYRSHRRRPKRRLPPPPLFWPPQNTVSPGDKQAQPPQQRNREVFPDQALLFSGPIHYCATAVNEAYRRSSQHVALATRARQRQDHEAASKHLDDAFTEVSYLKNDHWYLADLWNFRGCLLYDQGFNQEAREIWERALLIAEEWPDKTAISLPTIQSNLALARGTLGF